MSKIVITDERSAPQLVHNEHIVPRFYLNRFADAEKQLIVYAKCRDPRRKSTKSQSSGRDYFEYTIDGHGTQNRYEKWFGRIEADAAAIYEAVESGSALTPVQDGTWSMFLATLFLRSSKVREQIGPELMNQVESEIFFGEAQIRQMQHDFLKQGFLVYADHLRVKISQIKQEMRAPAFCHLAGIEENARALANDIFGKRWFVLQAAPGTAFVTSDCPVQTMRLNVGTNGTILGCGFGQPETVVVLPLSPTRLFLAGPHDLKWKSNVLEKNDVAAFNSSAVRFSCRAVYGLERCAAIKELVDREMNQVVYGRNAFVPSKTTVN